MKPITTERIEPFDEYCEILGNTKIPYLTINDSALIVKHETNYNLRIYFDGVAYSTWIPIKEFEDKFLRLKEEKV